MSVRWRGIAGWEGMYSISDSGLVRSERRVVQRSDGRSCTRNECILRPMVNGSGHHAVKLWRDDTYSVRYVHQLVLEAFIGPRPIGMESLHGDGNPANNNVGNLKWGTASENRADSVRHRTHGMTRKTECPAGHQYDDKNTRVNSRGHRYCRACNRKKCAERRRNRLALSVTA